MKSKLMKIIVSLILFYALFGFLILPMIIQSQIEKNANTLLNATVSLQKVVFNPFTMKIKLQNLLIADQNKELIKFKELSIDFSVLKSIHKQHISFKQIRLSDFYINAIQNKDGSINLLSLLKQKEENTTETSTHEEKKSSIIPFKISKTILDNARIKIDVQNGDNPISLDFANLNYTFYELGTYKNSLASHSLNTTINKDTKLTINGGFNLVPFKMYGKVNLSKLHINQYIPYSSNLLKFNTSDATIDMNLGYQIDLSNGLKARVNNSNITINKLVLSQKDKDFIGLQSLNVKNINLAYPEQKIDIESINIDQLFATAIITKKGQLNFANLIQQQDGHRVEKVKAKREKGEDIWDINIDNINLNTSKLNLNDHKNEAYIKTKDIKINLNQTSLVGSQLNLNKITLDIANIDLNDKKNKANIRTKNIKMSLDKTSLQDSKVGLKRVNLNIEKVNLNDRKNKTKIYSNKVALAINNIQKNEEKITVKKINVNQPYTIVNNAKAKVIARNLNLTVDELFNEGNYLKVKKSLLHKPRLAITVKKDTSNPKNKASKEMTIKETKKNIAKIKKSKKESNKEAMNLDFGPFKIAKANITFEDKNLPIPFKTNISKLNGNFSELITKSSKPTKLKLEGQVDKYGYTKITGLVDHKNIKNLTDVQLLFKNIAIKNFTPYSGKFVGRELADGKLNLNLKYNITKSNIDAKNSIIVTDIKLGKQIESPTAMSLPLELAIALMEDTNGVIDLNIPISGNVDDPEFSIAPIVWKAFSNLIIKAVTSPFRFLASLFDFDEEEIKAVEFAYGNTQLIASEKETLDKIAQIFAKRPNIALKVQPTFNSVKDTQVLQNRKFELFMEEEVKKIKKGEDKYLIALEKNYALYKDIKPLKELKKEFIKKDELDTIQYVDYLKEFFIKKQIVSKEELSILAKERANTLSQYLQKSHKIASSRVIINEEIKDDTKSKEWVAFNLEIGLNK